jgi:putative peptidoglycan lipid II flippase
MAKKNVAFAEQPAAPAGEHHKSLLQAAGVVGMMTILSRILGLWRFRIMGHIFGATGVADAFNFAFIFPNLTRKLFGEGAMTAAFVPVFSRQLAKGEHEAASKTGSVLLCRLAYWLSIFCIALIVLSAAARFVLPYFFVIKPDYILEMKLFEALLPYCVLVNISAALMGLLNSLGHFAMPAFAPVILNALIIAACYCVGGGWFGQAPSEQIWAVAIAVLIGGVLQVLVQIPPALSRGFRFKFHMDTSDKGFQEVMAGFKPVMLLVAVFQINVVLDNVIAQVFIKGSGPVTYLNMGTSIYQLPWSIFSLALGTAALPALSKFWGLDKREEFTKTLLDALRMVFYLAIPCTIGIMILSDDIVRLFYRSGQFMEADVRRTGAVAFYSTAGLIFFSVNAVLARALYAMKDMKTPTTTSFKSVFLNLSLNLLLVNLHKLLPSYACTDLKEGGIALASAISQAWQAWMQARAILKKLGEGKPAKTSRTKEFILRMGMAAVVSVVLGMVAYRWFASRPEWEGFWPLLGSMAFGLAPFWLAGRQYFTAKLNPPQSGGEPGWRYGVKEEAWPEDLKFQFSLYSTILAGAIMGFLVWAVRDSVPPEGRSFTLVAQRALAPVIAGVFIYATASSGLLSREYEELKAAFTLKLKLGKR